MPEYCAISSEYGGTFNIHRKYIKVSNYKINPVWLRNVSY